MCNRHIDDKDMCEEFFKKMTSKVHEESNEPKVEPEVGKLREDSLVELKSNADFMNTLGNVLLQYDKVPEATKLLEKCKEESPKGEEKIMTLKLLDDAYEQGGEKTKQRELNEEHPEIKLVQKFTTQLQELQELQNKAEEQIDKKEKEKMQVEADLLKAQQKIGELEIMIRDQAANIEKQADNIEKLKKASEEVSPAHLDAITRYVRTLSRQYSEK
ncbi:unnamed protein product [Owenia fusiformis]|uniref:Uncharacterized protein n=1 Tax=Owenia fusiformis TaxID=6347 RepID=A0A8S4PGA2_OWEFU|nr:unnamed protein product [Owenia fusiformis]